MRLGLVGVGEVTGRFDDDVDAQVAPREQRRVALRQHLDLFAVDRDRALTEADLAGEGSEHGVVLQQVGQGLGVRQVVDGDDLDIAAMRGRDRAVEVAPDTAETVDADTNSHDGAPRSRNWRLVAPLVTCWFTTWDGITTLTDCRA